MPASQTLVVFIVHHGRQIGLLACSLQAEFWCCWSSCGGFALRCGLLCVQSDVQKAELSTAVRKALYASKITSYAQGLNIIRAKSIAMGWGIEMGELTRIWKVRHAHQLCFRPPPTVLLQTVPAVVCNFHLCNFILCCIGRRIRDTYAYVTKAHVQGGCIIRAGFLDDIKNAYKRNPDLENLVLDDWFANKLAERQDAWRDVVKIAITNGKSNIDLKTF